MKLPLPVLVLTLLVACGTPIDLPPGGAQRPNGTMVTECSPREALCGGADILRCAEDGKTADVMETCDAGSVCTWCGMFPGCRPPASCSGNTEGLPVDSTFSNACDDQVSCANTTDGTKVTLRINLKPGDVDFWEITVDLADYPNGIAGPVNGDYNLAVRYVHTSTAGDFQYTNAPGDATHGGRVRFDYLALTPGSTVGIHLDGALVSLPFGLGDGRWHRIQGDFTVVLH